MERYFNFNEKNTFYDWDLILTEKNITPPEPKTNYVDIDGMSGSLDLSEALTGEITYNDRTISASFWTNHRSRNDRSVLMRNIRTFLHGRKMKIIEPDDPEHYFLGRVRITNETNIIPYAEISLDATCEPWRYSIHESERIAEAGDTPVNVVIVNHGVKTLCPTITVNGTVQITYEGAMTTLIDGIYEIPDIKLYHGANVVTISGTGTIKFVYREADL